MQLTPIRTGLALALVAGAGAVAFTGSTPEVAASAHCPDPKPMQFAKPSYVDKERAGGEPTVETHPDGTLIYSAHAGSTHVYAPDAADPDSSAFGEHYTGQTYYWWSHDHGRSWHFADRTTPPSGVPGSGFSDPEIAIDTAGNVYISEINLANVAVSKSTDSGHHYALANPLGQDLEDRQWMAADQRNVLYMTGNSFEGGTVPEDPVGNDGHVLFRSTDGGKTFSPGVPDAGGLGDIKVDQRNGTLYEAHITGNRTLQMVAFRDARQGRLHAEKYPIAHQAFLNAHWPSFDVDRDGNLYAVWDENGKGPRAAGIYYAYSRDAGRDWSRPVRLDGDGRTDIWPWVSVGDPGHVAVAWLQAEKKLPGNDPETQGTYGWKVVAADSLNGLGCQGSRTPGFTNNAATGTVHRGTICNGGTVCQAEAVDRRMGDFFTISIDDAGRMWAGYSDTMRGGAVSLPGFVRQDGGPRLK